MSYDEWNISKGSPVEKKMMLFDQFSRPSGFFAEQRAKAFPVQTQVIRDQQNWNNPPTWADLDHQRNQVMNQHQRAKKQPSQRNPKKPHFDKPNSIDLTSYKKPVVITRRPVTRKITTTRRPTTTTTTTRKPATTRKPLLNRWGRPTQNRPGFQGQARPGFQNRPVQKPTQKPTRKPTTKAISDDDFMNLIAKLEIKNTKTVEKKSVAKKSSKSPKSPSKKKASLNKPQLKMATKAPITKAPTTKAPTTQAPTTQAATTKKGPWSHLPMWKQRQLMAARKRKIAAFKAAREAKAAAEAAGGKIEAQSQMMKFSQWAPQPEDAKASFEEGPIIEVESSLSDDEFSELISTIDAKSDLDIARIIQSKEATDSTKQTQTEESENDQQH